MMRIELHQLREQISNTHELAMDFGIFFSDLLYIAEYSAFPIVIDSFFFVPQEIAILAIADMLYPEDDDDGVDKDLEPC